MIDNLAEMKIILKKTKKWKTEHADNDVTRHDPANVSASDLHDFIHAWELNLHNTVGFGAGDRLGERDAIIVQASDGTQTDNVGIFFFKVKGIRLAVLLLEFHSTFSEPCKIWRFLNFLKLIIHQWIKMTIFFYT